MDLSAYLVLSADQIPKLMRVLEARLSILLHGGDQEREESIDEFLRVRSSRAKVNQLDLWSVYRIRSDSECTRGVTHLVGSLVEEEIAPIRIGLHQLEMEELSQAQLEYIAADL